MLKLPHSSDFGSSPSLFRLIVASLLFGSLCVIPSSSVLGQIVKVGKGSYRTDLPAGKDGQPRRLMKASPLVSRQVDRPAPTNDWCSSLVWPTTSPHSLPMFPHPLAVQAHESGLGLGYNPVPEVTDSRKDGKLFQKGSNYKYAYRESMIVGLDGLASSNCVLDHQSDWAITALWNSNSDRLRATFGHGLPFVYFERESSKPASIQFLQAQLNRHEHPVDPIVFEMRDINGRHTKADGKFILAVNAGKSIGLGSKVRIRYDFNGDGDTDRVETFALMPTDPVEASFEKYSSDTHALDEKLSSGDKQDFKNGIITVEFWKCFGKGALQLKLSDCQFQFPIKNGLQYPTNAGKLQRRRTSGFAATTAESSEPGKIFYRSKNVVGVTVNRTHYGLFAPSGATWSPAGNHVKGLNSGLAGKNYFSVAVLPDANPETVKHFAKFAFAFVRDTKVDYQYDRLASSVKTTFRVTAEAKEGSEVRVPMALYRHQHLHVSRQQKQEGFKYASPRGDMKVVTDTKFTTSTPFLGVLPALPTSRDSHQRLGRMVEAFFKDLSTRKPTFQRSDTYWNGKEFGKICEVIQISNHIGKDRIRNALVKLLQQRLESWFDARNTELFFYYDSRWNTLIGYPDSYGSAETLNDHHFHYSYFIKAAATIAQYDPEWVRPENYGGMIDLLIRNCANDDRTDTQFPWMRFFDPYAGHSWASGNAAFASGNNQESSSESMNFATALILYGDATNNQKIRDLGIYWHATEAEAIRNYWFDNDRVVFPKGFGSPCVGMVWGDGGTYGTWWTANPEEIHGINFLPLNGGSLYLGRDTEFVQRNFDSLLASNKRFHNAGFAGDPNKLTSWQDIVHEYLAVADALDAKKRHRVNGAAVNSEFGETKVHTAQWIAAFETLGHFDSTVHADSPTAVCFKKRAKRTYVVYNSGKRNQTVTFSDGAEFQVKPGLHRFTGK